MSAEKRARELLAAAYEGDAPEYARQIRSGDPLLWSDVISLRAITAALTPQWAEISTAPRVKAPMIVVIGVWDSYVTDPYAVFWDRNKWARWPHKAQPTHWLPLPAPPEGEV